MKKEFNLSEKMTLEHYEQPMFFKKDIKEFIRLLKEASPYGHKIIDKLAGSELIK